MTEDARPAPDRPDRRRLATVLLLGFASGLPLALSSGTLQAWLATTSVDIRTIGAFSLVGLPYTLKFLWSPLMDRFVPPLLGRRRGWITLAQAALAALLAAIAFLDPEQAVLAIGMLALGIAFCSASQDVAFDAYRTDLLHPRERGLGAAFSVTGYRLAMIVSGGFALIIADHVGWQITYLIMAGIMVISIGVTTTSPEPTWQAAPPATLQAAVVAPFMEFFSRERALWLLVLIVLYKLGDAFAGSLTTAFLIRGLDFSLTDVGIVNKWMGLAATILGVIAGGALMVRMSLFRCLLWFGIFQAITNFGFMVLALVGKSYVGMILVIAAENLAGGMGTAAFVALLMALCDHRYTATQFALLSSLAVIGRVFIGPAAGAIVDATDWVIFFFITFFAALPGLWLLTWLRAELGAVDRDNGSRGESA